MRFSRRIYRDGSDYQRAGNIDDNENDSLDRSYEIQDDQNQSMDESIRSDGVSEYSEANNDEVIEAIYNCYFVFVFLLSLLISLFGFAGS